MKSSPPSHVSEETPKPLTRTVNKDSLVTQGAAKEEPKEKSSVEAASTEHAETLPVTAPPAGISKKAMAKALEAVKTTPCLWPEEQCKALGKTPKPKGRPRNKHAKAKATPKAKSTTRGKKANATPKAKSTAKDKTKTTRKAKTGDRKRKAGKTTETNGNEGMEEEYAWDEEYKYEEAQEPMDWEEDDTGYDEENGDHSHDTLPPASKTRKPRGKGKTGKAAPSSSSKAKVPKASSSSSKAKAPKAKAKASSKKDKKVATQETTTDPDTVAKKARLSRKSCASKKARREALNAGKTPEEAKAAAAKATWLLLACVWMHVRTVFPLCVS